MEKESTLYQIIKEYKLSIFDNDKHDLFILRGKVMEQIEPKPDDNIRFLWEVSHHYKPDANSVGVYIPGRTTGSTSKEVEITLLNYMNKFSNIGVVANDDY